MMYAYYLNFRPYGPISFLSYYSHFYLGHGPRPPLWTGPSWPDINFGHLWFVEHLLIFAFCYWLWRLMPFSGPRPGRAQADPPRPSRSLPSPSSSRPSPLWSHLVPHRPVDRLSPFCSGCFCRCAPGPLLLRDRRHRLPARLVLWHAEEVGDGMAVGRAGCVRPMLRPLLHGTCLLCGRRPSDGRLSLRPLGGFFSAAGYV